MPSPARNHRQGRDEDLATRINAGQNISPAASIFIASDCCDARSTSALVLFGVGSGARTASKSDPSPRRATHCIDELIVCPIGVPVGSRLGGKSQADSHHLLKGPEAEDHTLYASHTVWKSRATFEAWTKSEAFRAHYKAGDNKTLYLGHPQFEGFEIIQAVGGGKGMVAGSPR